MEHGAEQGWVAGRWVRQRKRQNSREKREPAGSMDFFSDLLLNLERIFFFMEPLCSTLFQPNTLKVNTEWFRSTILLNQTQSRCMGTYHMGKKFLCNQRTNELIKFIKNLIFFTDVLLILLYLYIKFQDQNHGDEIPVKGQNF
jgi:hypothetical protein